MDKQDGSSTDTLVPSPHGWEEDIPWEQGQFEVILMAIQPLKTTKKHNSKTLSTMLPCVINNNRLFQKVTFAVCSRMQYCKLLVSQATS